MLLSATKVPIDDRTHRVLTDSKVDVPSREGRIGQHLTIKGRWHNARSILDECLGTGFKISSTSN